MTCDLQDKSSERVAAEEDKSVSSRADYNSSDGSYCSDDTSSSSSWDSDLDDLEAFVLSSSVLKHRTQSSPVISSLRKTQDPAKQLMARMRKCESFGFPPCLSEHVKNEHELSNTVATIGRFGDTTTKPEDVLDKLLRSNGISSGMLVCADCSFLKVTDDHVKSYAAAAEAAREGAMDKLQKLYQDGTNLQASNIYGETLVHLVCRRGESSMLRFLIGAKVSVRVRGT
jgi:hypothetical protein